MTSISAIRPTHQMPALRRRRQGRQSWQAGAAAEDQVARHYTRAGAAIRASRYKTAEGEIDLIAELDDVLVFVEVKHRKSVTGFDAPISRRQWQRLEAAALSFMQEQGEIRFCRFDVALTDRHGGFRIIENAHCSDSF